MGLISKFRDRLRLNLYRAKYDFKCEGKLEDFNFAKFHTVVISKIDGKLGDTQVITPFITSLKKSYPKLRIVILTSDGLKPLYDQCLHLKSVLVLSKRPQQTELDECLKEILTCDLFVTLEAKFRFHDFYLLNKLKPKFVAGINHEVDCVNLNLADRNPNSHITAYFEDLLRLGGCTKIFSDYVPFTTYDSLNKVKEFCKAGQISFAPWGASKHKHLKDEVIVKIAQKIVELTGQKLVLLVPPDGNYLKEQVLKVLPKENFIKVPDKLNVFELASIISLSKAVVSVDTANVHLTCASKLPLFAIYNANHQKLITLWAPHPKNPHTKVFYLQNRMIDELSYQDLQESLEGFLGSLKEITAIDANYTQEGNNAYNLCHKFAKKYRKA